MTDDQTPETAPDEAGLGPKCGDNGGRKGKYRKDYCPSAAKDEDGRCGRHPIAADPPEKSPALLAAEAERKARGMVVASPGQPLLVAKDMGRTLHPRRVTWPPPKGVEPGRWKALLNVHGDWWEWDVQQWCQVKDQEINNWMYGFLGKVVYVVDNETVDWNPTSKTVGMVQHALANHVLAPPLGTSVVAGEFLSGRFQGEKFVSVENGLLHARSKKVLPHDPKFFNTYSVPLVYDPDAEPPAEWLKFLNVIFRGDAGSIRLLRTWMCAVLVGAHEEETGLMILGPTRSGKGTIHKVLSALLGAVNVFNTTLDQFGEQFGLEGAIGKALIALPDVRIGKKDPTPSLERMLSIIGRDYPSIPRKGITNWEGKITTFVLYLSNDLPTIKDSSGALGSRFKILRTRVSFKGKEDRHLSERLMEELAQILKWALDATTELEYFGMIEPKASAGYRAQLEEATSEVATFLDECCGVGQGEVRREALREAFNQWRNTRGNVGELSAVTFGKELRAANGDIEPAQRGTGADRFTVYTGVYLLSDPEGLL